MPVIVTKAFTDSVFFIPFTADKSEGVYAKPATRTLLNECRREAMLEAGADVDLAENIAALKVLTRCIDSWKGFYDPEGNEIHFNSEILKAVWENDPAMFTNLYLRHRDIARMGELADEKN